MWRQEFLPMVSAYNIPSFHRLYSFMSHFRNSSMSTISHLETTSREGDNKSEIMLDNTNNLSSQLKEWGIEANHQKLVSQLPGDLYQGIEEMQRQFEEDARKLTGKICMLQEAHELLQKEQRKAEEEVTSAARRAALMAQKAEDIQKVIDKMQVTLRDVLNVPRDLIQGCNKKESTEIDCNLERGTNSASESIVSYFTWNKKPTTKERRTVLPTPTTSEMGNHDEGITQKAQGFSIPDEGYEPKLDPVVAAEEQDIALTEPEKFEFVLEPPLGDRSDQQGLEEVPVPNVTAANDDVLCAPYADVGLEKKRKGRKKKVEKNDGGERRGFT
ncbi:hypothetical protein K470DRAFT_1370 [Piedraia hortae CBS 480.64]|uniref:Uncharacterized protein n=1 Tax=Piedraia hortae CBS 480.64 TaxID=1314780 RepID=A0A6A7C9W2_9PEZI|nr:hypothetical protein K470DRAFT_1370 [Piedraia hortae CBS 480.64]